jgi:hypothetical protein
MIDNLNKLSGGVGDNTPSYSVDPVQLSLGVQIEMEHTNNHEIAQEIAMDHLTEDPKYYTKLVKAGLAKEFKPSHNSGFGDPEQSFNDESRIGRDGLKKGNMHGKIGGTSDGKVDGRNSKPIINKTVDIELEEQMFSSLEEALLDEKKRRKKGGKKRKPKPTNPSLWAACKAWARSKFDVYPSAYANAAAAKRYKSKGGGWRMSEDVESSPVRAYDGPFPAQVSPDGQGTYGSGYDFVGFAENKSTIMKKEQIKEAIKKLVKQTLIEQEQSDVDASSEDTVTITLDKQLAQKLHDLLMTQLQPESPAGPEDSNAVVPPEDDQETVASDMSSDQLPVKTDGEESVDEITFEEERAMDEAKEKWIQKAIGKPGTLHKQLGVPAKQKIPAGKLAAAAKKGGKLGKRARLAQTLGKISKK